MCRELVWVQTQLISSRWTAEIDAKNAQHNIENKGEVLARPESFEQKVKFMIYLMADGGAGKLMMRKIKGKQVENWFYFFHWCSSRHRRRGRREFSIIYWNWNAREFNFRCIVVSESAVALKNSWEEFSLVQRKRVTSINEGKCSSLSRSGPKRRSRLFFFQIVLKIARIKFALVWT